MNAIVIGKVNLEFMYNGKQRCVTEVTRVHKTPKTIFGTSRVVWFTGYDASVGGYRTFHVDKVS